MKAIKEHSWAELDLEPRDRALCEVAEKMSATPTRMVESDWKPLRELGFGDDALLEIAHIVGLFNYLTRLADGLGLRLDPETLEASTRGVALRRSTPPEPGQS